MQMKPAVAILLVLAIGCGPKPGGEDPDAADPDAAACLNTCDEGSRNVVDCHGAVVEACDATESCDPVEMACNDACTLAAREGRSVGCDYYATAMDTPEKLVNVERFCFAAFVSNTWTSSAHISVRYRGASLPVEAFTRVPTGSGPALGWLPYDDAAGLAPGEVAVLFLGGVTGERPWCPIDSAVPDGAFNGTGVGDAFHITTDVPVVAYQMNPVGGVSSVTPGASLLLPTSVWSTEYVAVNAAPRSLAVRLPTPPEAGWPSLNIIARDDDTVVTVVPAAAVDPGPGVSGGAAGVPFEIALDRGQHVQISQAAELTGSVVTSNRPVGVMAGHVCMNMPVDVEFCDHAEQMIPPVRALGSHYVGVMYRPRVPAETSTFWRLVGVVDDTRLAYSADVGGPATLRRGESVTFTTGTPFVVSSQDRDHPFMLFVYMSSSTHVMSGYGDADFVLVVPTEQYLSRYVFFADPTFPETNLVIVRNRALDGAFKDVVLDCAGPLQGWQPIDSLLEYTRVDLSTGNFQPVGGCSTGRHSIESDAPFGVWVWGWGSPLASTPTRNSSYGYPAGMNVSLINDVEVR
jgi:hypothetical protein